LCDAKKQEGEEEHEKAKKERRKEGLERTGGSTNYISRWRINRSRIGRKEEQSKRRDEEEERDLIGHKRSLLKNEQINE
jgi:hypothetical protein